jgi:hypothetical protein
MTSFDIASNAKLDRFGAGAPCCHDLKPASMASMAMQQEPKKMELPTIYKAYFWGLCKGISPQNWAKHMVRLRTSILKGSWKIDWKGSEFGQIIIFNKPGFIKLFGDDSPIHSPCFQGSVTT